MTKWYPILILTLFLAACSGGKYTGSPELLGCTLEDLPGDYILLEDISGERPNDGLITENGDPEGTTSYIETTGRLNGWENRYMLITPDPALPGFILCEAVTFENSKGASQALNWESSEKVTVFETERKIGDEMIVTWSEFANPDGDTWVDYRVEFTWHNLLGVVHTYAPKDFANPDQAMAIAELMLARFENPPVPVTEEVVMPTLTP